MVPTAWQISRVHCGSHSGIQERMETRVQGSARAEADGEKRYPLDGHSRACKNMADVHILAWLTHSVQAGACSCMANRRLYSDER